jgi:glutamyl-tRNA reductase
MLREPLALIELGCPPLEEVVILSACNRLEIYAVGSREREITG